MTEFNINDYREERSCTYRGEEYLVRDNGAVLRKSRPGGRRRKCDDVWTLGSVNKQKGYYDIASVPVHRIVATAFLGEPPTNEHVVDHIDTNRRNNRPKNLRWMTRLENAVRNENTRKKIEHQTGVSIYEFLDNPAEYRDMLNTTDLSWMGAVTEDEAKTCSDNLKRWCENSTPKTPRNPSIKMGEVIFKPHKNIRAEKPQIMDSLTPLAKQKDWNTPTQFVCCPEIIEGDPIQCYMNKLSEGASFSANCYGESSVVKYGLADDGALIVMTVTADAVKPLGLVRITFENGIYVHMGLGTFMTDECAEKHFTIAQGFEWTGGDCLEDYW
jgi:hypothetical protein